MTEPDFSDCVTFTVDPDAEPVDLDDVVAEFLMAYIERPTPGQPPTASGDGTEANK